MVAVFPQVPAVLPLQAYTETVNCWAGVVLIRLAVSITTLKLSLVELAANVFEETPLTLATNTNSLVELSVQDMFPLTVVCVAPGPAAQLILAVSPEGALGKACVLVAVGVKVGLGVLVFVGAGEVGVTTSFKVEVSPLITAY